MEDIRSEKNTRIKRIVAIVIETVLFYLISINLIIVHEKEFQTEKDYSFIKAVVLTLVLLIGLSEINYKKITNYIWFAICVGLCLFIIKFWHINATNYGPLYSKILWLRILSYCLGLFLLPYTFYKDYKKKYLIIPIFLFMVLVGIFRIIFSHDIIPIFIPFVIMYFMDIESAKWIELTKCLAIGYYLAFATIFTYSLIVAPTVYYIDGRYYGIFMYPMKTELMCCIAIICVFYLFSLATKRNNKWVMFGLCPFFGYAMYGWTIVAARGPQAALVMMLFISFLLLNNKSHKAFMKKIIPVCVVAGLILLYVSIGSAIIIHKIDSGEITSRDLSYFWMHIYAMFNKETSRGVFPPGTILNSLDYLSSGRMTIWKGAIDCVKIWGLGDESQFGTHNTYLYWFVKDGLIGGITFVIWIILSGVDAIRKRNNPGVLLCFMYSMFFVFYIIWTNEYFISPGMYLFMFLQYSLIRVERDKIKKIDNATST